MSESEGVEEPGEGDGEEGPGFDELSPEGARKLIDKLRQRGEAAAAAWRSKALVNEAFSLGDQLPDDQGERVSDQRERSEDPRIAVNLFAPLLITWVALITKDRPTASAVPATQTSLEDLFDARFQQALIESLQRSINTARAVSGAMRYAAEHGSCALKITVDMDTGAIVWAPTSIFNFIVDPSKPDDPKSGDWVIFDDYGMTVDEAVEVYEAAGIDKMPQESTFSTPGAPRMSGVHVEELWLRPCHEHPTGVYAQFIGGELVYQQAYPLVIERGDGSVEYPLPIAFARVRDVRGTPYGHTNFTDAVPLQRAFNECVNRAQKLLRTVTAVHLRIPQSVADEFDPDGSEIAFPDGLDASARAIDYTKPGEISPSIFTQRDFFEKAMQKVVGLNDVTASVDNPRLSGTAIENMVQLDAQRNADAARWMQTMVLDAWELTLDLVGEFYRSDAIHELGGVPENDIRRVFADRVKRGDVRLELGSEVDTQKAAKENIAADRLQRGVGTPGDVKRAAGGADFAASSARAAEIVQAAELGVPPDLSADDVDPDVLEDEVAKAQARSLSTGNRAVWIALEQIMRRIPELRARRQQMAQGLPPGAGGGAGQVPASVGQADIIPPSPTAPTGG